MHLRSAGPVLDEPGGDLLPPERLQLDDAADSSVESHLETPSSPFSSAPSSPLSSVPSSPLSSPPDSPLIAPAASPAALPIETGLGKRLRENEDGAEQVRAENIQPNAELGKRRRISAPEIEATFHGPPHGSNNRQAFCDAHPMYKAHQSSIYRRDNIVKGFLIVDKSPLRDSVGAQVVVTMAPGGKTKGNKKNDVFIRSVDQTEDDTWVKDLIRTMKARSPVLLVLGKQHQFSQTTYAGTELWEYQPMDFFYITDVTLEKGRYSRPGSGGQNNGLAGDLMPPKDIRVFSVRFEKVDLVSRSWWYPVDRCEGDVLGYVQPGQYETPSRNCESCGTTSEQIYADCWTCLNARCVQFFRLPNGLEVNQLQYHPDFLRRRRPKEAVAPAPATMVAPDIADSIGPGLGDVAAVQPSPYPATPSALLTHEIPQLDAEAGTFGTERAFRVGIVCLGCKQCLKRVHWDRWECGSCGFVRRSIPLPYPLQKVREKGARLAGPLQRREFAVDNLVVVAGDASPIRVGHHELSTYLLKASEGNIVGGIVLLRPASSILGEVHGPDELFQELDITPELGLQRNVAKSAGSTVENLTRHFASNFGAPYKFWVSVQSKGFEDAPDVILKGLQRLSWAGMVAVEAVGRAFSDAMQATSTEQHASPLAPSPAPDTELFRPFNELMTLGYMEADKINYHDDGEKDLGPTVATMSLGSPCVMRFCPHNNPTRGLPGGNSESPTTEKPGKKAILSLSLQHGDIVVMHGEGLQRHFLHEVTPYGKRRYAMTSRFIKTDLMIGDERRNTEIKGRIPERAAKFVYHGGSLGSPRDESHADTLDSVVEELLRSVVDSVCSEVDATGG